jgi:hypothetical protein
MYSGRAAEALEPFATAMRLAPHGQKIETAEKMEGLASLPKRPSWRRRVAERISAAAA